MEEGGGTLTVRLRWPQESDGFGGSSHDRLLLEVMDTGAGIKPEETPEVFNPFFTTKSGGTGLGLAIAHKIVEDHGGTVTFRSSPGHGTVFTVALPARAGRRADLTSVVQRRSGTQAQ
jgi:signal transduction histidine kinase